ncbi:hypothetical protein [Mesorhizobium sp. ZC-5]|uniref:hypothetical protein n=1 Tax=Mesorhizobium sp. ZC-5 TaxID=2986066 RepID=UPI0021E8494C|nr:hypothetical protein [Mesorhizobium sp. ZC-5]MCV3241707.1 hypothetical protein [Mesorhizobium sp. ZC-5]
MAEAPSKSQVLVARIAITAIAILIALGLILYGLSGEVQQRLWQDIFDRPGGPMSFRFVLQPIMAAIAAFHDGAKDARLGREPYMTRLLSGSGDRTDLLKEAVISTGRILLLGLVMDGIYQFTVLKTFYPGEMVIITLALALVPYLLLRGLFSRLARSRSGPAS